MAEQAKVDNLAAGVVKDPARFAECNFYYEALLSTLNASHRNGEQDAFALLEAIAMVLGQVTGNFPPDATTGALHYVTTRALMHAEAFVSAGKAARYFEEAAPEKFHG